MDGDAPRKKKPIARLLDAAGLDLDAATRRLADPPNVLAANHLQQAAEKIVSAVRLHRGLLNTKDHDLVILLDGRPHGEPRPLPAGDPWRIGFDHWSRYRRTPPRSGTASPRHRRSMTCSGSWRPCSSCTRQRARSCSPRPDEQERFRWWSALPRRCQTLRNLAGSSGTRRDPNHRAIGQALVYTGRYRQFDSRRLHFAPLVESSRPFGDSAFSLRSPAREVPSLRVPTPAASTFFC